MHRPAGCCWGAIKSSRDQRLVWWPRPLLALQAVPGAGIYPGVSNVMAAHMVSTARREYDSEGRWVGQQSRNGSKPVEPKSVRYYYYTAGTGGLGLYALRRFHLGSHILLQGQQGIFASWTGSWPRPTWRACMGTAGCALHVCQVPAWFARELEAEPPWKTCAAPLLSCCLQGISCFRGLCRPATTCYLGLHIKDKTMGMLLLQAAWGRLSWKPASCLLGLLW